MGMGRIEGITTAIVFNVEDGIAKFEWDGEGQSNLGALGGGQRLGFYSLLGTHGREGAWERGRQQSRSATADERGGTDRAIGMSGR
jgi:hypothetical protein